MTLSCTLSIPTAPRNGPFQLATWCFRRRQSAPTARSSSARMTTSCTRSIPTAPKNGSLLPAGWCFPRRRLVQTARSLSARLTPSYTRLTRMAARNGCSPPALRSCPRPRLAQTARSSSAQMTINCMRSVQMENRDGRSAPPTRFASPRPRWAQMARSSWARTTAGYMRSIDGRAGRCPSLRDRNGELVGIVFDINREKFGGNYVYTDSKARTIAVDGRAIAKFRSGVLRTVHACSSSSVDAKVGSHARRPPRQRLLTGKLRYEGDRLELAYSVEKLLLDIS